MFYEISKRLLDIIGALVGIILFSPAMIVIAIAVKLYDGGPVFYDAPPRVGKNGKLFKMYKFRSMILNAHEKIKTDPEFKKFYKKWKENQGKLKIAEDPRITPVGRIIRKTDIDETAQFFNVLKGEMSIVGARACFADELEDYKKQFPEIKKYLKIAQTLKPGITGPWQVSGRNNLTVPQRFRIDAKYAKRKSILYDIYIILKTPFAMISRLGAYE